MDLNQLKEKGGIVEAGLVKKEITWTRYNDEDKKVTDKFDVFIRRLGFGLMERVMTADPSDPDRSISASLISEAIRLGENGEEVMTYVDAYQLQPTLAACFTKAIKEVNQAKPAKK